MNSSTPSVSGMSIKGPIGELLRVVVVNSDRTEKLLAHDKLYRKSNAVCRFSLLRDNFVEIDDAMLTDSNYIMRKGMDTSFPYDYGSVVHYGRSRLEGLVRST